MQGQGDTVTAIAEPSGAPGSIVIERIVGDEGRLSFEIEKNCIGIAARETLRLMGTELSCGIRLRLHKGLPLGSGMGSSAASAAAACWAVNLLFGKPLQKRELVYAGLQSESIVSGYHADNIAPALLGGFVLVRWVFTPLPLLHIQWAAAYSRLYHDHWFSLLYVQAVHEGGASLAPLSVGDR
jgi:homoserine kinase